MASTQHITNVVWACSELLFYPEQLLLALEQQPRLLQKWLKAATARDIASFAYGCASLGYSNQPLFGVLLDHAVSMQVASWSAWDLTNLCWAAAVLDKQQSAGQVVELARVCTLIWGHMEATRFRQLYQVHKWLQHFCMPEGLSPVLTAHQLEQCRDSWQQQIRDKAAAGGSQKHRDVFAVLQQLPASTWQQSPVMEQLTADGDTSVDIGAVTATGIRLAIEVDGPYHFLQPGNRLNGPTQARNRLLAALGYTVVSLPYFEWEPLRTQKQKQTYLLGKLAAAQVPAHAHHTQQQQQPAQHPHLLQQERAHAQQQQQQTEE
jgi:hypothetical protein